MQEKNTRLIDEAISFEPVKNTFRLGWEFVTLNKKFTMTAMVVLLALSLLGLVPVVGFVFSLFSSAFSLAIQIYAGRLVYETANIESFVNEVHNADGQKIIERYFAPALGAYFGWMVMALLFVGMITLALNSSGVSINVSNNLELFNLLSAVGLPLLLLLLIFSYVQPLVQANIVMANDFKEGFFAVLTLFSADVWRRAMQGAYFKYISIYGVLTLLALFAFGFLLSIFSIIPILNMFVMVVFIYVFSIMMSVSAVIAKRIVE